MCTVWVCVCVRVWMCVCLYDEHDVALTTEESKLTTTKNKQNVYDVRYTQNSLIQVLTNETQKLPAVNMESYETIFGGQTLDGNICSYSTKRNETKTKRKILFMVYI